MKIIFKEIFPPKNPVAYQSKMDTGPLIKFIFSEFDSYQFFPLLTYYTYR